MKLPLFKIPEHFIMGMVAGSVLTALLIGSMAFNQIEKNRAYGDEMVDGYLSMAKRVEQLKQQCGQSCE